ncbi:unnamed protein product, partial [Amoebophrya sp. A25]|eukprot:GSA25T00007074001.1
MFVNGLGVDLTDLLQRRGLTLLEGEEAEQLDRDQELLRDYQGSKTTEELLSLLGGTADATKTNKIEVVLHESDQSIASIKGGGGGSTSKSNTSSASTGASKTSSSSSDSDADSTASPSNSQTSLLLTSSASAR